VKNPDLYRDGISLGVSRGHDAKRR